MKRVLLVVLLLFGALHAEEVRLIACQDSCEMIELGLAMVRKAQQSIEFSPCFFGGEVCQRYLAAFERQMRMYRRLQIHILLSGTLLKEEDRALITELAKNYPRQFHVTYTHTILDITKDLGGIDNHVKMLVIDERYFTAGGTNYDDSMCTVGLSPTPRKPTHSFIDKHLPAGSRDQDLVGKSQVVARQLRREFHKLTALWTSFAKHGRFVSKNPNDFIDKWSFKEIDLYKRPYVPEVDAHPEVVAVDSSNVHVLLGAPSQKRNVITEAYVRLIDEAEHDLFIGNLYFCPVDRIMRALQASAKRGVTGRVISNGHVEGHTPSHTGYFIWANRISYLPYLYGRTFNLFEKSKCRAAKAYAVSFYEFNVQDILYHKKVLVADQRAVIIGSFNLGYRSDMNDYELALVIDSPELAKRVAKPMEDDLKHSISVSSEEIRAWYFDPIKSYTAEVQKKFHTLM